MKCFDAWTHFVVMLYAVIMCFDSLREITGSLQAEARKLSHLGISMMTSRCTLSDANKRCPESVFEADTMYQTPKGLEVRIQQVAFAKQLKNGEVLTHRARVITYADQQKHKLISLLANDMELDLSEIIAMYHKRWEIELLFKQMKQNFPIKYFYGESANAIKIQIWVTLIANLLLILM